MVKADVWVKMLEAQIVQGDGYNEVLWPRSKCGSAFESSLCDELWPSRSSYYIGNKKLGTVPMIHFRRRNWGRWFTSMNRETLKRFQRINVLLSEKHCIDGWWLMEEVRSKEKRRLVPSKGSSGRYKKVEKPWVKLKLRRWMLKLRRWMIKQRQWMIKQRRWTDF